MMNVAKDNETGFTLLEVILAMVILGVGIMVLLMVVLSCTQLEESSRQYDVARTQAAAQLEGVRATDFDNICATFSGTNFSIMELGPDVGYIGIDDTNTNLLDVTVTVTWWNQTGVELDLTMKTMVARSTQ